MARFSWIAMARFSWIAYCYILYLISQIILNAWYSIEGKPIYALGILNQWWFMICVFILAFVSEWISILLERREV